MRIGAYEILGELGRGGAGVVYRARALDGRSVALKLVARSTARVALERFERERRLLASLGEADGFVPLLDMGEEKGQPYLVMPIFEGGTLRDRLGKGALPVGEAIGLAESLANALSRAHAKGIVHRDLKPENVLYDRAGRPFVADLGLAKHFDVDSPGASQSVALSKAGQMLGTVGYMAPEQARDGRSAGPAADVFATGAILFEALAGWPAFGGSSVIEVLAKVDGESPPPVSNVRPETPPWLAAVIEHALARDPAARYPDGAALLAAIRARDAVSATRGPLRALRLGRKHALLALPVLLALLALGLAAATGPRSPSGTSTETSAPPGPPKTATSEPAALARDARGRDASEPARRCAAALARLQGTKAVTSGDAPADLLLLDTTEGRALRHAAAERGTVYALADVARLSAAFPGEHAASVLEAIAALGSAGELRARAERTLAASKDLELAPRLALLARFADAVAAVALSTEGAPDPDRTTALPEILTSLARASPEAVDLAATPLTFAVLEDGLGLVINLDDSRSLSGLATVLREGPKLPVPPRLARACHAYHALAVDDDLGRATNPMATARLFDALARDREEPAIRAAALAVAVTDYVVSWRRGDAVDTEALSRDGLALLSLAGRLEEEGTALNDAAILLREAERELRWYRIMHGEGDRAVELALGSRRALEVMRMRRIPTARDDRAVLQYALESGAPSLLEHGLPARYARDPDWRSERDALVFELFRRRHGARALLEARAASRVREQPDRFVYSVFALAEVELGRFDEARADLAKAGTHRNPPSLTSLARDAVARVLAAREAR